jgi:ADP-ribosyl-[dinitrogen reductase] hydrolase
MGVALAEAFLAAGTYDPDTVWAWFRSWAATAADIGVTTRSSLRHTDWRDVPATGRGAGNGALMRAFVLALALLDADAETVREIVLSQAALTHSDPAAGWGAWMGVEMCRHGIRGGNPLEVLDELLAELPDDIRPGFAPLLDEAWVPGNGPSNGSVWGCLAEAVWAVRTTSSFEQAVVAAVSLGNDTDTVACVTGAIAGSFYGVQAIPARWSTYVHGSISGINGPLRYQVATLQTLATRLLGLSDHEDNEPERPAGPVEVAPGLHAADLLGAAAVPTDWAVVSLCRTAGRFDQHPVRRQVFLIDQPGDHNIGLEYAVHDAVAAIDAFLAEGRTVVVHCHGGRSRTGLVLKAWKMRTDALTEREAHEWLAARWFRYHDQNPSFVEFLSASW